MVVHVSSKNFEKEVMQSDKPVLLDFWAEWCGPCRMLSPIIDQVTAEATDAKVCKINVDEEPELAQKFGIMSIPTLAVMHHGEVKAAAMGVQPKAKILNMLKSAS